MANNNVTYIGGRIKSAAKNDPYVAESLDIFDENLQKNQQTINSEGIAEDAHLEGEVAHLEEEVANRYTKEEVNNIISRTPETDVIVIDIPAASQSDIAAWLDANTPSGTDPETGRSVRANKLYRVPGPTNTTYSEWAWDGTAYICLANKDYGIDEEPDPNSDNMAKSSGIVKAAKFYAKNAYILKNTVISKNAQPSGQPDTGIRMYEDSDYDVLIIAVPSNASHIKINNYSYVRIYLFNNRYDANADTYAGNKSFTENTYIKLNEDTELVGCVLQKSLFPNGYYSITFDFIETPTNNIAFTFNKGTIVKNINNNIFIKAALIVEDNRNVVGYVKGPESDWLRCYLPNDNNTAADGFATITIPNYRIMVYNKTTKTYTIEASRLLTDDEILILFNNDGYSFTGVGTDSLQNYLAPDNWAKGVIFNDFESKVNVELSVTLSFTVRTADSDNTRKNIGYIRNLNGSTWTDILIPTDMESQIENGKIDITISSNGGLTLTEDNEIAIRFPSVYSNEPLLLYNYFGTLHFGEGLIDYLSSRVRKLEESNTNKLEGVIFTNCDYSISGNTVTLKFATATTDSDNTRKIIGWIRDLENNTWADILIPVSMEDQIVNNTIEISLQTNFALSINEDGEIEKTGYSVPKDYRLLFYNYRGLLHFGDGMTDFLSAQVKKLESATPASSSSLPEYYGDYMDARIDTIYNTILEMGRGDIFGFITDTHPMGLSNKYSGLIFKAVAEKLPMNKVIFGGDIGCSTSSSYSSGDTSKESIIKSIKDQWERLNAPLMGVADVLYTRGNHDFAASPKGSGTPTDADYIAAWQATRIATKSFIVNSGISGIVSDSHRDNANYYFIDDTVKKIRYIFLDTCDWKDTKTGISNVLMRVQNTQIEWLVDNALLTTPNGYDIVVTSHVPLAQCAYFYTDRKWDVPTIRRIKDILVAANNRETVSIPLYDTTDGTTITGYKSCNFTAFGANVVLCLGGHLHWDAQTYENDICFYTSSADFFTNGHQHSYVEHQLFGINLPAKASGTVSEDTENVIVLDLQNSIIYVYRFGIGVDKKFRTNRVTVSAGGSIELQSSLSGNVVWKSYDAVGQANISDGIDDYVFLHTVTSVGESTGVVEGLSAGGSVVVAYSESENMMEFFNVVVQ